MPQDAPNPTGRPASDLSTAVSLRDRASGIIAFAIVLTLLYLGRDVLIPLTLALMLSLLIAPLVFWLAWTGKPNFAIAAATAGIVLGVAYLKGPMVRQLDERVSARTFWRAHAAEIQDACIGDELRRDWQYQLNYYAGRALPLCDPDYVKDRLRVTNHDGALFVIRQ